MLKFEDIKFDCELYNGYKPCKYGNECAGCPYYVPRERPTGCASVQSFSVPAASLDKIEKPLREILIIKTGAMGDVLRTTTLLPVLKRKWPECRVTWITDTIAVPLLRANPMIETLLAFNDESCDKLAGMEFDLLLNFEKEKAPLALASRIRAPHRVGFAPTPWNTATIYNRESEYALLLGLSDELKFRTNKKTYPAIICEMTGLEYRRDRYVLELSEPSEKRWNQIENLLSASSRPRIGLNTGCGAVFQTKQWTLEGWIELVEFLQANADAEILLLGGKAETELNKQILARTTGVIDTGCDNPLEAFFGVVEACDILVTSDSLAMHIATALGKYVVAIFGSTSPTEVDLYDFGEKVVTDFACSPCYLKTCDKEPTCMKAMRGSTVGEAVMRGLSQLAYASG